MVQVDRRWGYVAILAFVAVLSANAGIAGTDPCALTPRAAQLVNILDKALQEMLNKYGSVDRPPKGGYHPDWGPHCSQYVRAVMREMESSGYVNLRDNNEKNLYEQWITEGKDVVDAEGFGRKMPNSSEWQEVSLSRVQDLANSGAVVVGASPQVGKIGPHVGVAFPIPPTFDPSVVDGQPFVRDGNEHLPPGSDKAYPSTYGAVRASIAFPLKQTRWFVLKSTLPSDSSTPSFWDRMVGTVKGWFSSDTNNGASGTWIATSQYGGIYKIEVRLVPNPSYKIADSKPVAQDSVMVDQAPSPDEIAMGTLVGQPAGQWTAFANDQEHPRSDSWACSPLLFARSYYSVPPPPSGAGVYMRQSLTRINFGSEPASMTTTYDFWPESYPQKIVRFVLSRERKP